MMISSGRVQSAMPSTSRRQFQHRRDRGSLIVCQGAAARVEQSRRAHALADRGDELPGDLLRAGDAAALAGLKVVNFDQTVHGHAATA
jgi:hypothetical protein